AARDAARARSVPCCAAGSCALHCTPALPAGWTLATPEPGARHGPHPRHAPPSGEPRDPPWRPPPLSLRASA
ncbi:MAG: hypothetical protein NZ555_14900, partial [Geminicoccaceae bacterium]|nr:hypothetical protein [Geminicoccaceae bacterium]